MVMKFWRNGQRVHYSIFNRTDVLAVKFNLSLLAGINWFRFVNVHCYPLAWWLQLVTFTFFTCIVKVNSFQEDMPEKNNLNPKSKFWRIRKTMCGNLLRRVNEKLDIFHFVNFIIAIIRDIIWNHFYKKITKFILLATCAISGSKTARITICPLFIRLPHWSFSNDVLLRDPFNFWSWYCTCSSFLPETTRVFQSNWSQSGPYMLVSQSCKFLL